MLPTRAAHSQTTITFPTISPRWQKPLLAWGKQNSTSCFLISVDRQPTFARNLASVFVYIFRDPMPKKFPWKKMRKAERGFSEVAEEFPAHEIFPKPLGEERKKRSRAEDISGFFLSGGSPATICGATWEKQQVCWQPVKIFLESVWVFWFLVDRENDLEVFKMSFSGNENFQSLQLMRSLLKLVSETKENVTGVSWINCN